MKYAIIISAVLASAAVSAQQLSYPLSPADQANVIPKLCDAAVFASRAQWQFFCDVFKAQVEQNQLAEARKQIEELKKPKDEAGK